MRRVRLFKESACSSAEKTESVLDGLRSRRKFSDLLRLAFASAGSLAVISHDSPFANGLQGRPSVILAQNAAETGAGGCYFGECETPGGAPSPTPRPQPPQPPPPSQPPPPLRPSSLEGHVEIDNDCRDPISATIHYKTLEGSWVTTGWYRIEPYALTGSLYHKGIPVVTDNDIIYTYAQNDRRTSREWSADDDDRDGRTFYVTGERYRFRMKETPPDSAGVRTVRFACR